MREYPCDMFLDDCFKHPFVAMLWKKTNKKQTNKKRRKRMAVNKKTKTKMQTSVKVNDLVNDFPTGYNCFLSKSSKLLLNTSKLGAGRIENRVRMLFKKVYICVIPGELHSTRCCDCFRLYR